MHRRNTWYERTPFFTFRGCVSILAIVIAIVCSFHVLWSKGDRDDGVGDDDDEDEKFCSVNSIEDNGCTLLRSHWIGDYDGLTIENSIDEFVGDVMTVTTTLMMTTEVGIAILMQTQLYFVILFDA